MAFITENIRLRELVSIVGLNRYFYDDFVHYLHRQGYENVLAFVTEAMEEKARLVIETYLKEETACILYDGVGKPYQASKAKWYFLAWLFRDAPAQRLNPLLKQMPGRTTVERAANLLNELRKHTAPLFPRSDQWEWPAISEVLLARLEGSRRALRGSLFEGIVRLSLEALFKRYKLSLKIGEKELRINDETYDVQVCGKDGQVILLPVKTRETMGGGHALLFTRDIYKSISVAAQAGHTCVPVVIAESWGGKLDELGCKNYIYIRANPNQVEFIQPLLAAEFEKLIDIFRAIA